MNRFLLFIFPALVLVYQSEAFAAPLNQGTPAPTATPDPYESPAPEYTPMCVSKEDPVAVDLLAELLEPTTNEVEGFAYSDGDQICVLAKNTPRPVGCCKYWFNGVVGLGARLAYRWETQAACERRKSDPNGRFNARFFPRITDPGQCALAEANEIRRLAQRAKQLLDQGRQFVR